MEIKIPKIFKKLELKDYAAEFGDVAFNVWVNPPRAFLNERHDLISQANDLKKSFEADLKQLAGSKDQKELKDKKLIDLLNEKSEALSEKITHVNNALEAWYAGVVFEGERQITKEEITQLFDASRDTDPQFNFWLIDSIIDLINDHRMKQKN